MAVEQIRILHGGLTWPSVRGARLLQCFTSSEYAAPPSQDPCNDPLPADFPYDLELCVPTAGHVALVLVRRSSATPTARTLTQPLTPSGSSASAPAAPRVVYVLDALPPPRRRSSDDKSKRKKKTPQLPQQPVDELELLHELFEPQSRAAGGKDSSVLVKAPLLCARFDCKVVSIRFLRSGGGLQKSTQKNRVGERVVGAAAPLRCVVAREDGMAYLWEWQADLFQWVFLNRLCFLENPNLKWTRPVAAFTTTDLPLASVNSSSVSDDGGGGIGGSRSSGVTEFAWWSTATKHEPKLKLRRLRFERAADALRATDVVVGSAFSPIPSCDDIVKLLGSKLGLFAVSKVQGIFYRSASASLRTVALDWGSIFALEGDTTGPDLSQILMCVHSVTGELVLLHRKTGEIYLVTPKSPRSSSQNEDTSSDDRDTNGCNTLFARKLTTLSQPSSDAQDEILDMTAHRHVILVLTQHMLRVYTLIGGDLLGTADIPTGVDQGSQNDGPKTCKFWTIPGSANAVGLWAPDGFWTIRLPSAKAVGAALHDSPSPTGADKMKREKGGPEAAFLAVKDYGTGDLHLDAVRYALEVLERVTPSTVDPIQRHPEAWEAVWHTVSSPALLLALLDNRATTEKVVNDLAQYVAAIYAASTGIRSVNRFNGSATTISKTDHLLRLTPANLESLHHLSNWIVLAKRKLARLGMSEDACSTRLSTDESDNRESRAVSDLTDVLANDDDLSTTPPSRDCLSRKDSVLDPKDARNFRLSRKLRPMSSLRFAAGCSTSSERQGRLWLLQLEAFLLDGVAFKHQHGVERRNFEKEATPSHRLFHSERMLADFRNVTASSFSKHMYLESMSRLYLLHEPEALLPFIRCVERFCPRIFSLTGHQTLARSHAERAQTLFPPVQFLTNKVLQGNGDAEAARASLLAYVDLLIYCGHHSEACRALLSCHLYDEGKQRFLLLAKDPQDVQNAGENAQEGESSARDAASTAVYFLLVEYCIKNCDAAELKELLVLKPAYVDMLHVLRALRTSLSSKSKQHERKDDVKDSGVKVGDLRSVLLTLMQQRRAEVVKY